MIEIFIVIKEGDLHYYLLKVQRRGFDVYCFPPHLGMHYTVHESGEAHLRSEGKVSKMGDELPVIMFNGEAGTPSNESIIRESLVDWGVYLVFILQSTQLIRLAKIFEGSIGVQKYIL